jgi:aryl-alcohol dehydrogenase-like predicted oxidoreductase
MDYSKSLKRREFLKTSINTGIYASLMANLGLAAPISSDGSDKLGKILPTRPLGQTGEILTQLGVGGDHVGKMEEKFAQQFLESALEEGVRFFDNAHGYGRGRAEELYGKYLCPKYRQQVFVMTKSTASTGQRLEEQLDLSLKRLNTDFVDLMYLHSLKDFEDVDSREKGGVFDRVRELQQTGKVRHIGFSCHTDFRTAIYFLEKIKDDDFVCCCQTPINTVDAGDPYNSFTSQLLPRIVARGHSHIAMKTLAAGALRGGKVPRAPTAPVEYPIPELMSLEDNFNFVLSQPVTAMVSGMASIAQLKENAQIVRNFKELSARKKAQLVGKVAAGKYYLDPLIEAYKSRPEWAIDGYS